MFQRPPDINRWSQNALPLLSRTELTITHKIKAQGVMKSNTNPKRPSFNSELKRLQQEPLVICILVMQNVHELS